MNVFLISTGYAADHLPGDPFRVGVLIGHVVVQVEYPDGSRVDSKSAEIISSGGDEPFYQVRYVDKDGRVDAFSIDGAEVRKWVKKYGVAKSRWRVPRTTGGYAAGRFVGLKFEYLQKKRVSGFLGCIFNFDDFKREGEGSKGRPLYTDNGFVSRGYAKHGIFPGRQFSWQLPENPMNQRFVLDFGKEQIVPIQVLGYQDGHAIFTLIDYRHDAKKMEAGQFYNTLVYQVEAGLLRMASDRAYMAAASQYIDDRSGLKPSDIVRANRAKVMQLRGQQLRIKIGANMSDTMLNAQSVYGSLPEVPNIQGSMCGAVRSSLSTNFKPSS